MLFGKKNVYVHLNTTVVILTNFNPHKDCIHSENIENAQKIQHSIGFVTKHKNKN